MSYSLVFTEHYERMERRFLKTHPDLLDCYHKTLALLEQDPFHPSLRLHPLGGRLAGLHAVSINLQYRITLELELRGQEIILVTVARTQVEPSTTAFQRILGRATDLGVSDLAEQHDHYLYGTEKQ